MIELFFFLTNKKIVKRIAKCFEKNRELVKEDKELEKRVNIREKMFFLGIIYIIKKDKLRRLFSLSLIISLL